jgi:hypothetical protein
MVSAAQPRLALAALLLVVGASQAVAKPLRFTLEVSPTEGGVTDTYVATVQLELSGVSGPERYWHPDFDDFEVVGTQVKQGTSSVIDPVSGQEIRTLIVRRYNLKAKRSGRIRIKPAKVRLGREEFETRDVTVKVGSGSSLGGAPDPGGSTGSDPTAVGGLGVPGFAPPERQRKSEDMFLHAVADKREVWLGEQVTVTWLLYTRSEVLKFEPRPPSLDGLWAEILYEPDAYFTYHEDTVGGVPYVVAVVSKRAVFPTQTGRVEVKPFRARVASLSTSVGRSRELASRAIELQVKALPAGAPPGFNPTYVGRYEVESEADRSEIEASESLTLTVKVRGEGAIRRTQAPVLDVPGFTFRAPRDTQDSIDTSTGVVSGERTYLYWTTPEQGGPVTVPAVELPYFDPSSGSYQVASSRPIPIFVKGDPTELARASEGSSRENVIPRDIRLIHAGAQVSSRRIVRLGRSPWFWPLAALPPLALLLVVGVDRVRQRMKKDTPRARLRRARGRARKRFRVAEIHVKGNRPAKFYGELSRVLYDHVEERVGQPVQSMTRDELKRFLAERGFGETTIKLIDHSLETFDFARFAPSEAGPGEMRAHLRQLKELLQRIERTRLTVEPDDAERAA